MGSVFLTPIKILFPRDIPFSKKPRKLLFLRSEIQCQAHNELFISAYFKKFYVIGSCRRDLCIGTNPFFRTVQ